MAVTQEVVRKNFERFGLLDSNVKFLKGWFSDTLPSASIEQIAVLRLDGDYYSSTMDALTALYDRVEVGGYVIIDDYGDFISCRRAVDEFLQSRHLSPSIVKIDSNGVYWRKE